MPAAQIDVAPPPSAEEASLDGLTAWSDIVERAADIAQHKLEQVCRRWDPARLGQCVFIAADTTIIVPREAQRSFDGCDAPGGDVSCLALAQPPDGAAGDSVVRDWFTRHYAGRGHHAVTAVCVRGPDGATLRRRAVTLVEMRRDVDRWLDWYIATGEPSGKAGGYAVQGAGSVFIQRVTGSLSNVVGLPLEELLDAFAQLNVLPQP